MGETVLKRLLSYANASRYLSMSTQTLRRAVDSGKLRAVRPGGGRAVRFDIADLDRFARGDGGQATE